MYSFFQHSIIPRGSLSLKVLAELPIIVVLMYQVSTLQYFACKYFITEWLVSLLLTNILVKMNVIYFGK